MSRTTNSTDGFTPEERAAMKEHAAELRAAKRRAGKKELEVQACLDKIADLPDADRAIAERIHALVTTHAPSLDAKTWYGMPAYTTADGKVICFFQAAGKFNTRYATFGFQHDANLDDGNLWPTAFAVINLTPAEETKIRDLVSRAATPPSAKTT